MFRLMALKLIAVYCSLVGDRDNAANLRRAYASSLRLRKLLTVAKTAVSTLDFSSLRYYKAANNHANARGHRYLARRRFLAHERWTYRWVSTETRERSRAYRKDVETAEAVVQSSRDRLFASATVRELDCRYAIRALDSLEGAIRRMRRCTPKPGFQLLWPDITQAEVNLQGAHERIADTKSWVRTREDERAQFCNNNRCILSAPESNAEVTTTRVVDEAAD